jgi:hypothetical protein
MESFVDFRFFMDQNTFVKNSLGTLSPFTSTVEMRDFFQRIEALQQRPTKCISTETDEPFSHFNFLLYFTRHWTYIPS